MTILPPKRFHPIENSIYDPIRHKPWFCRLARRRRHIPRLRQAYEMMLLPGGKSQKEAAREFNVDPRELRDYFAFRMMEGKLIPESRTSQCILDEAYAQYDASNASNHIRFYIDRMAPKFGVDSRPIIESWETNPTFYPSGYAIC